MLPPPTNHQRSSAEIRGSSAVATLPSMEGQVQKGIRIGLD